MHVNHSHSIINEAKNTLLCLQLQPNEKRDAVKHTVKGWLPPLLRAVGGLGGPAVADDAPSHPAGERLFVDYAGQTVELIDRRTGEVHQAQVFVAVLCASSYTYAAATFT